MARKSSRNLQAALTLAAATASLLLGACASTTPWPAEPEKPQAETQVHSPASQSTEGTQVYPLQNPAVKELLADAGAAGANGDFGQAATLLERALRIQPRDPEILQSLAEVQLQIEDYGQALSFATRSYDLGPRVGEICSRNWRTISVSRERLGDLSGADDAAARASQCISAKPKSL